MSQQAVFGSSLGSRCTIRNTSSKVLAFQSRPVRPRRIAVRISAALNTREEKSVAEPSAALLLSLSSLLAASPAIAAATTADAVSSAPTISYAASSPVAPEAVDSAVTQIIEAVKAAGGAVKSGLGVAAKGAGYVKEAAETAAPYVKKGVDVASPYVKAGANLAQEAAKPVIKAAGPIVQSGVSEVEQFLTRQGLNSQSILDGTKGVTSKAEEAINYASPTVKSTAGTLSATNPQLLAKYALGLAALYYLGPPILKGVFGSLRGFAGQISPAAALDAAANENNAIIIDIRTANEKEYAGIPDLPNSNRLVELEFATVTDRKIRNQLRNVNAIEKQMTVLQIASLKKVKKGTKILLLDKNGSGAKDIAKALTSRGYKRVFVISGGFGGWTASKLKTRGSSTVSAVEILGPVFGTRSSSSNASRSDRPSGRFLPSGR